MIQDIINKQRAFFRSGKTLSVPFRKEHLEKLKEVLLENDGKIGAALMSDLGKSSVEAYMCETGMVLSELSHAIRHIRSYSRRRRVRTPLAQFPARSFIIPEPYGNVLVMSPWNYPLLLSLAPVISAVAAGNTVILKPSAYSPATSAVIADIVRKVFPEEYVAVVEGGRDVNSDLLEQKFDYIFFTGSKTVGRLVMSKAAEHLTPVTLELGGKSPVIVDRRLVLTHESLAEDFLAACRDETRKMFGEHPLENPDYGKIVNRKHFDRLCRMISELKEYDPHMAETWSSEPENLRIEPVIVSLGDVNDSAPDSLTVMQEEIFGPVMPVLTYSDIEDVIKYIDERPRPLAAYIFTSDRTFRETLLARLHFGGGCVNDTIIHLATEDMPFGGVGESGMGHYHGRYGFETFSHLKSIVDKPLWLDLPMRYQPYTRMKEKLIRMFLK